LTAKHRDGSNRSLLQQHDQGATPALIMAGGMVDAVPPAPLFKRKRPIVGATGRDARRKSVTGFRYRISPSISIA
jgi:hypothetical protein